MMRDRKDADKNEDCTPQAGSYPAVGAVVIGLALGIVIAAVTREAAFMLAGLVAGALVAYLVSRPRGHHGNS